MNPSGDDVKRQASQPSLPQDYHCATLMCHHATMPTRAKLGDQPVNVRLPRDLHEAVLARAEQDDRTMAQTIRVALRYYLQETTPVAAIDHIHRG